MLRASLILATLLAAAGPALAEEAAPPGPVGQIALSLRLYEDAARRGDALGMAVAARLAGEIRRREATQWQKDSGKYAGVKAEGAKAEGAADAALQVTPDLLTSGAAWSGALLMAEEDEALSDLLYELPPVPVTGGVSESTVALAAGQQDSWRLPFAGQSPAEIAVFATLPPSEAEPVEDQAPAPMPLMLWSVRDSAGALICPERAVGDFVCSFTPAENGFYTVTVANPAAREGRYLLMTN